MIPTNQKQQSPRQDTSYEFPISKERELATWLDAVSYHAEAGSRESQDFLLKLVKTIPDSSFLDSAEQQLLKTIKEIASKKPWDPQLSPNSKSLLRRVCQNYLSQTTQPEKPKAKCAVKLDFSNLEGFAF